MKSLLTVAVALSCITATAQQKNNALSEAEKKAGWELLFDGVSTKGWHTFNKSEAGSAWKIENGELYLDNTKKDGWQTAGGGDIVTDKEYKNFDLKLEWKISEGGNSGIIFYVQEDGKHDYTWQTGPEMQVVDNEKHPDGKLIKHQAGDLYDLISCSKKTVKPAGEWNQVEIISKDGSLDLFLNGEKVVSTTLWNDAWKKLVAGSKFNEMPDFGKFTSGKIALQDHGDKVFYRNIRIKEL